MSRETKRWILWVGRLFTLIIYLVFLAYAVIVGIAFVLQLLGANPEADFADWIYRAAASITEPFRGIFPTTQVSDRSTFNASLLFALIVYLVSIPLGVAKAVRDGSRFDVWTSAVVIIGNAVPSFLFAIQMAL